MTAARRPTPPDRQPNDRQRQALRDELHTIIDHIITDWPNLTRQANDMQRGYPTRHDGATPPCPACTSGHGDHQCGGTSSPTERHALTPQYDPAQRASELLAHWQETIAHLRVIDRHRTALGLLTRGSDTPRTNTVELCGWCGEPAIRGKRFDGALMHNEPGKWCHTEAHRHHRRGA
jgi:hypothetical protein